MTPAVRPGVRELFRTSNVVVREVFPESSSVSLVERQRDRCPLGLLTLERVHRSDGHAYLGIAQFGTGLSRDFMVGAAIWVDSLFAVQEFRKLYAEATDSSLAQFSSGLGWLFEAEGRLKAHKWVDETVRMEDIHILSVTRERWAKEGRPFLERLVDGGRNATDHLAS